MATCPKCKRTTAGLVVAKDAAGGEGLCLDCLLEAVGFELAVDPLEGDDDPRTSQELFHAVLPLTVPADGDDPEEWEMRAEAQLALGALYRRALARTG